MLPKDFPPFTTVQGYFYDWRDDGCLRRSILRCCWKHAKQRGREPSPRPGSSTVNRSRRPRAVGRGGTCGQEGKRPQAPHCDRYWTVCWSAPRCTPPMSKIAMVPCWSLRPSTSCFPGYAIFSPTVSTTAPTCARRSPNSATGPSRSVKRAADAAGFKTAAASLGRRNEPWLGSIETAAWPRISRLRSPVPASRVHIVSVAKLFIRQTRLIP